MSVRPVPMRSVGMRYMAMKAAATAGAAIAPTQFSIRTAAQASAVIGMFRMLCGGGNVLVVLGYVCDGRQACLSCESRCKLVEIEA